MVGFAPICFPSREKTCGLCPIQDFNISSSSNVASFPCRKHTGEQARASSHSMAQSPGKLMDTIRRPVTAASSVHQSAANHLQPVVTLAQRNGVSRRCLLTLLASAAAIPEASESRKALLQDYVKRSKENKEKNDKEWQFYHQIYWSNKLI
ncbi:hypothetical protein ACQ4PT_040556 [Festuca glaucescens]